MNFYNLVYVKFSHDENFTTCQSTSDDDYTLCTLPEENRKKVAVHPGTLGGNPFPP